MHKTKRYGRSKTTDRYVSISGDIHRWTGTGRLERERETGLVMDRQMDRERGRRRAAIRTKTSVTFRGFSLLPSSASGP